MSFVGGKLNLKGVKIGGVKKKKKKKGEISDEQFEEPEPVSPVAKEVPHLGKAKIIKVRILWHRFLLLLKDYSHEWRLLRKVWFLQGTLPGK